MLFETSWSKDFEYYERVYNPDTKESICRKIPNKFEWYVPSSNGLYTSLLDSSIRLEKIMASNPKEGRDKYGFVDPIYVNIRNNYNQKNYNDSPNIWYLDIETRAGGYKYHDIKVKVRKKI